MEAKTKAAGASRPEKEVALDVSTIVIIAVCVVVMGAAMVMSYRR